MKSDGTPPRRTHHARRRAIVLLVAVIAASSLLADGKTSQLDADEPLADHALEKPNEGLSLATFDLDVTPPVGFMMAYDRVRKHDELGLRCRGVIILGAGKPIVLCAVDWIGIGNQSHDAFRERLAQAVGTSPQRVAVHTLHQHDAPRSDFGAESVLQQLGNPRLGAHDGSFARRVIDRLAADVQAAIENPRPLSHAGYGPSESLEGRIEPPHSGQQRVGCCHALHRNPRRKVTISPRGNH